MLIPAKFHQNGQKKTKYPKRGVKFGVLVALT